MRIAAFLTSRVTERLARLPGVATLDWCDRAASALTAVRPTSRASVLLAVVDAKGFIERLEAVGAAAGESVTPRPAERDLDAVRQAFAEGDWLGWAMGPLSEGRWFVSTAGHLGLGGARQDSPLWRRWLPSAPSEIIVGGVTMQGGGGGRVLMVELAAPDANFKHCEREQAVLAAALPFVAQRLHAAIGDDPAQRHTWLTPREEVVLWQLAAGKNVPQIAADLRRSVYTVHDHVKSLHRKLGASSRGELVARALGHIGASLAPFSALI